MRGGDVGQGRVFEDAAVEEGHDVEGGAYDAVVFTETEGAWDGHVGLLEGVDDAVFAVDLMGGLGEELARRLLSHDIFGAIGGFEEVGWVALTVAELSICMIRESEAILYSSCDGALPASLLMAS